MFPKLEEAPVQLGVYGFVEKHNFIVLSQGIGPQFRCVLYNGSLAITSS